MLIEIPDLREARRLLCVQPHYDDNDIGAGGTLACLAREGAELFYLTVADDLLGVLDAELPDSEARRRLIAEQDAAARHVGVQEQIRLEYPDAGRWDEVGLRTAIVREIRRIRPDFVVTVDPWLPAEAHRDHVRTGLAATEAALLYGLPRVRTVPAVDDAYRPHSLRGVALTFTAHPNTLFDVQAGHAIKHRALDCYTSQFTPDTLRVLHAGLEAKEREWGRRAGCNHAEALRVLHPAHLHCNPDAEEMAGTLVD
jgi:LmbE family N-acetylglucosaminyl deacetylase